MFNLLGSFTNTPKVSNTANPSTAAASTAPSASAASGSADSVSDSPNPPVLSFWNAPAPAPAPQPSVVRPAQPDLTQVCRLSRDPGVRELVKKHNLSVVEVSWDDMARDKFSCVGANITDATLRAKGYDERCSIIRPDNYLDHTGDFAIDQFRVKVGNEKNRNGVLESQPLRTYLNDLFRGSGAKGDVIGPSREILVAAQTCILPLKHGRCEFNMELFNYQTSKDHPACLAIVCSASGTSAQVITERGAQPLYFNRNGEACDFFAERLKEVRQREGRPVDGAMSQEEEERNMLLVFQVPLRIPKRPRGADYILESACLYAMPTSMSAVPKAQSRSMRHLGVDHAQLGVMDPHGPMHNLPSDFRALEIDPNAAIRCTVQHYLVTDKGSISEADVAEVRHTMDKIYGAAKAEGSLVVDADAEKRSTAPKNRWLRMPHAGNGFWFLHPTPFHATARDL